jgi:hypothetical protein
MRRFVELKGATSHGFEHRIFQLRVILRWLVLASPVTHVIHGHGVLRHAAQPDLRSHVQENVWLEKLLDLSVVCAS